jgi:RNA polymerase sigma-70 factor (ECF subfamily)
MSSRSDRTGAAAFMTDEDLVGRVIAGEQDYYRFLVQRHQDSLFRVAYSLVLDHDAAADLVQDAFLRAYVSLAQCRDPRSFRVWLLAMLRNRGLDYLKEKRRGDLSLDVDGVARRAESLGAQTEADADRLALRTALESALARLTDPLREAFVLRHVEQLSVEETASVLGTSISAVKMRVHRAREQLQDWLGSDYGDGATDVTSDTIRSS